ncbi:PREDICTED: TMV resistance protein N-like [Camelina sativa]|uniref:TMV resistance protein N-like n=1 Tax=Camelina sativa TaxID=90675 RepID=A0ABM1QQX2_CAMSA|nr:PREDICTED: TMV resistance protein N-like [Camelina sativa]
MASSSSHRLWNYDVFLSFRGEDTRKSFVSHLHKALVSRGIVTFKDDRKLEIGESISEELCKAIQSSRFAAVAISENYVTSRWCLEELRLIMELQGKKEIEVVPIFYGVNPSDVRNQRGSFALEWYQGLEMADKVLGWREALTRIANRKGKVPHNDFSDIVGMKTHEEGLSPLLNMDANDEVRMIGIWGMGGIGKTTIVKRISSKHGLLYLQEQLLSNILGEEHVKLWSVEQGVHCIKSRLGHLKVFIILDDVNDVNQLHALAKEARWFGLGSRIIVTTRDKSLLNNSCGVRFVYDVKFMDNDTALKLFEQVAFEGGHPPSHVYKDLSICATGLAQGLPLALEAFGFYLHGKSIVEWKDGLKSFEEAPYENITSILNISYNSLDEVGKAAFLHVACLFNGDPVLRVSTLLNRGEFEIRHLAKKSLIDISTDGCIAMHGLVEQTGRHIVRPESGSRPAKQRILWHPDDIYALLANYAGTSKIEGITLDVSALPHSFLLMYEIDNINDINKVG